MITTGIVLADPDLWIKDIDPTVKVCSDRKGGWMVRHKLAPEWIKAIPTRGLAEEVLEAFAAIESKSNHPADKVTPAMIKAGILEAFEGEFDLETAKDYVAKIYTAMSGTK